MTTLGFRYRIHQNTAVPRSVRANDLEQAVTGWLSTLAWSDWTVTSPSEDKTAAIAVPFTSIARLQSAGTPGNDFHEFNIMAFGGKPFYRELIDDKHGTNIYDEAIDRLWQTVQLLEIAADAAHSHSVLINIDRCSITLDTDGTKSFPPLCPNELLRLPDSLDTFRRRLRTVGPADLTLFETANFTVDNRWFDMMIQGAAVLDDAYWKAQRRTLPTHLEQTPRASIIAHRKKGTDHGA